MPSFSQALQTQRWDDHRYYHHSTINQSLHLLSATSFVCAYALMFTNPVAAALIGWLGGRPGATRGKAIARRVETSDNPPS